MQAVVLCKVIMLVVYSEVVINGGLLNHYVFHIVMLLMGYFSHEEHLHLVVLFRRIILLAYYSELIKRVKTAFQSVVRPW